MQHQYHHSHRNNNGAAAATAADIHDHNDETADNHADDVVLMPTDYGVPVLASPPGRRRE